MAAMLEAARLSAGGLRGLLRAKALGLAYLATLRVFLRDDSPDLAATMAALDRNLSRLDRLARTCSRMQYRTATTAEQHRQGISRTPMFQAKNPRNIGEIPQG